MVPRNGACFNTRHLSIFRPIPTGFFYLLRFSTFPFLHQGRLREELFGWRYIRSSSSEEEPQKILGKYYANPCRGMHIPTLAPLQLHSFFVFVGGIFAWNQWKIRFGVATGVTAAPSVEKRTAAECPRSEQVHALYMRRRFDGWLG